MIARAAIIALCLSTCPASAETALEMQSYCSAVASSRVLGSGLVEMPADLEGSHCWGAFGAVQELSRLAKVDGSLLLGICAPETSTRTQMVKIFQKYVSDHPEEGHRAFGYVVHAALWQAFPCSRR